MKIIDGIGLFKLYLMAIDEHKNNIIHINRRILNSTQNFLFFSLIYTIISIKSCVKYNIFEKDKDNIILYYKQAERLKMK